MALKHRKTHSTLLTIRNLHCNITSQLSDWQKFKSLIIYLVRLRGKSFLYIIADGTTPIEGKLAVFKYNYYIHLFFDLVILLLGIYHKYTSLTIQKYVHPGLRIRTLFVTAKHHVDVQTLEQLNKLWYSRAMEYYATTNNENIS